MARRYFFHRDAGHAWLKVEIAELERMGITNKISGYSYKRGNTVYLEEDCDAGLFINKAGISWEQIIEVDDGDRSPIRTYERYGKI